MALAAGLLLAIPGSAQMRSSVSAGPAGRPMPPGGGTGIRFSNHMHRGNHFGPVIYPYGFYDDFSYNDRPEVVEQPAPVVVIRDDRPAAPATAAVPPPDPKIIEVPETLVRTTAPSATPTAIFIFADGRRVESQNYTITDKLLTVKEAHRPVLQVPLDQLDLDATLAANHERGLELRLPESKSEILLSF